MAYQLMEGRIAQRTNDVTKGDMKVPNISIKDLVIKESGGDSAEFNEIVECKTNDYKGWGLA